jgi:hypothetical protein
MNAAHDDATPPDTIPVQLTRMEGTLNLINFQIGALGGRVDSLEVRTGGLELNVQRLGDAAVADKLTVEQTARALKDAKEATEAQARSELQKSDQAWTPINRLLAATSILSALVAFYFAIRPGG